MTLLGVDVARWQNPFALPYAAWIAAGLEVVGIQVTHGTNPEPVAEEHLAVATAAHVPVIFAYHYLMTGDPFDQCRQFLAALTPECSFAALDVEEPGVRAADVLGWTIYFDQLSTLPLLLYGNYSALVTILNDHPELKRFGIWWAQYAARETPPADLHIVGWQKLGSAPGFVGHLPPYAGDIDLTDWFEWPDGRKPMTTIRPGAGHGFHGEGTNSIIPLIEHGLAIGIHYKGLNSVENPGRCRQAFDLDPAIETIARFIHPNGRWENGQDVEFWSEAEHLECARAQIQLLFDHTNPWERGGIKFYTPGINEWNLDGDLANWTCVGRHLHLMMDEAERRSQEFGFPIKLAVPGIAQGKPQYWQMQQMVATGCFERMAARGDLFTVHAGRYRWQVGDPIPGLGDVIPQAPACPPYGGSGDGRVNYFYALGVKCDFAVTEGYDGLSSAAEPAVRLVRMKQTDDLYRHNPHYRFTAWYECVDNDDSPWRDTDFTPTFRSPEFEAEMIREAQVANPTGDDDMQPIYHAKALQGLAIRDAAGNPTTDPAGDPPAQPGQAGVIPIGRTVHVYAVDVTAGGYQNRATINPNGANVWGIAAALVKL